MIIITTTTIIIIKHKVKEKNSPKNGSPDENFPQVFFDKVTSLEIFLFLNLS